MSYYTSEEENAVKAGPSRYDFVIEDNKSLNHTYVGASELKPHEPVKLVHGDVVRLADVELKVSII